MHAHVICMHLQPCWLISALKTLMIPVNTFPPVPECLVIISSVVQSTVFVLLIWRLHSFKLVVITSHAAASLHFSILWKSFTGAKGIDTKKSGGRWWWWGSWNDFKTTANKWQKQLCGINLVTRFLQITEKHHLLFVYGCNMLFFYLFI